MENKHKILIVDDIQENLLLLSILLENNGYEVLKAENGVNAIEISKKSPKPDLILLDVMMPVMDGYAVCKKLKEEPDLDKIPVLFMSALDNVDQKIRGFREGGVDYITKPFQEEEILARINTHLQLKIHKDKLESLVKEQTYKFLRSNVALEKNEEQHRVILQTAMDGFWIVDIEGCLAEVNDAYCKMSGYTKQELLSMKISDLEVMESPEETSRHIDNIFKNGRDRFESRHRRKDGTTFDVEVSTIRIESDRRFVVFVRDITARKQVEDRLRESEYFFKESQRAAFIGSYKTNFIKGFWESSEVLDKIFGIEKSYNRSVEGWLDLIHPDDKEMMSVYLKDEVIAKHKQFDKEYRIIRKSDGEVRWVNGLGKVGFDKDGNIISMIGTIQDITDRKKIEATLQNSQRLESLGILAGGIAHDFNNLMAGIFGYIEMAMDYTCDEESKLYLSKATSTIERARGLTRQLLTFAKGGGPVKRITQISPIIQERAKASLKEYTAITSLFEIDENLWECNVDKNQIGQVIENIITNAAYSMNGYGTIELKAENIFLEEKEHPLLNKGNYIKISVKDHGVGIPKDMLSRIFDPFYSTKPGGHGLGLSICHSIIKRHRGAIDVESEQGKGSTFAIYLPAHIKSVTEARFIPVVRSDKGTILVMDDDEVIRDTLSAQLASFGYMVVCKNDVREALDFLVAETRANRPISGVIFDLNAGIVGGKKFLRQIKILNLEIPVFVMSGYAEDPVVKDPVKYGFTASIVKPFRKIELHEMLERGGIKRD